MALIDKYDKIGRESLISELEDLIGLEKSQYINNLLDINGSISQLQEMELLKLHISCLRIVALDKRVRKRR